MINQHVLERRSDPSHFTKTEGLPTGVESTNVVVVTELLARVEALLRQTTDSRETVLTVGPLRLDLLTRTVKREQRVIDLRPREFRLLEFMMRHRGQLLTRATLLREVWNYKFIPDSNVVDVHIGRLRRKISQGDERPMICTVPGQGFVFGEEGD